MSRVLLLINEISDQPGQDELDVLDQAKAVEKSLIELGYHVKRHYFSLNLDKTLRSIEETNPDFVFNLTESAGGKVSLIHLAPSLLESRGIPFTGSGSFAMLATTDKLKCKELLSRNGIPTPAWIDHKGFSDRNAPAGKYLIKPVSEDGSVGITDESLVEIRNPENFAFPGTNSGINMFAEQYIGGREFNLSILSGPNGPEVMPVAEMLYFDYPAEKPRILNYASKWDERSFEYSHTVRSFDVHESDQPILQRMRDISLQCWELFGMKGYVRVDFRLSEDLVPYVLEVNANPCISPDAGFTAACEKAGITYTEMIRRIIQDI